MYRLNQKYYKKTSKKLYGIIPRSLSIIAVLALVSGSIAYAALTSQAAVLKGNTIQTANAALQISNDGTTYSSSLGGYSYGGLVPGGVAEPREGVPVYIKNVGNTPIAPTISVTGTISNPNNIDMSKVHLILTPDSGGPAQTFSLSSLITAGGGDGLPIATPQSLIPTVSQGYTIQIQLDNDAINGTSAAISNVDIDFGGIAVN